MLSQKFENEVKQIFQMGDKQMVYRELQHLQMRSLSREEKQFCFITGQILDYGNKMFFPRGEPISKKQYPVVDSDVLRLLQMQAETAANLAVRAVLSDGVWLLTNQIQLAEEAYQLYSCLLSIDGAIEDKLSYLNRMISITMRCNNVKRKSDLEHYIELVFSECTGLLDFRPYNTLKYIFEKEIADNGMIVRFIDLFVAEIEHSQNREWKPKLHNEYLELKEKVVAKIRNVDLKSKKISDDIVASIRQQRILTLQRYAEKAGPEHKSISYLKQALRLGKQIQDQMEDISLGIKRKLGEFQQQYINQIDWEFIRFDASDSKKKLLELCEGKSPDETFRLFVSGIMLSSEKEIIPRLKRQALTQLLGAKTEVLNQNGKVQAVIPALDQDNYDSLHGNAIFYAKQLYDRLAFLFYDTIFARICESEESKAVAKQLIHEIVQRSLMIPEDRKKVFEKGLVAGIDLDFYTAMSILPIQMENAIFVLAENVGFVPYSLNEQGVEQRMSMETIFELSKIHEYLDEDIFFNLEVLFTSKIGYNVRNEIAHGVWGDKQFESRNAFWIWCLILKICSLFVV